MSDSFFTEDPENPDRKIYKLPKVKLHQYACKFCGVKIETTYLITLPMKCEAHNVLLQLEEDEETS